MNIDAGNLERLTHAILCGFGCAEPEASIVAEHLVMANLCGHDSHGVSVMPMYGRQVADGNLIPNQTPDFGVACGAITQVDARRGFGHRMALLALDHAMQTLDTHKVAILGLKNSGHISRTGHYAEYCAQHGYVSLHFVNVVGHKPLTAPHGSREAAFSTNPIAMAMPVATQAKPLLDMATSTVAFNKIRVAHNKGEQAPPGSLLDVNGKPTRDPQPMAERREGTLTAFGEHKGSGLAIFAELLAGALASDATVASSPAIPNGAINCMLSVIIDPSGFDDPEAVAARTLEYCQSVSDCAPIDGVDKVLLPGEPEAISHADRSKNGIPVDDETLRQLLQTGVDFGLDYATLRAMVV